MFCSKCGFELPDYANFCLNCGLSLKNPAQEKNKRIGVTTVWSTSAEFSITTTEMDIVTFCKEEYKSLGIRKKYYDYPGDKKSIPGTYYFRITILFIDSSKINQLSKVFIRKLLTEGWVETKTAGTYTKEF